MPRALALLLAIVVCCGLFGSALAESRTVTEVRFEGLSRVEEGAVKRVLRTRVGRLFTEKKVRNDIDSLHGLGYFSGIEVYKDVTEDGVAVIYKFQERPSVKKVELEGQDELDEDDINEAIDIKPYSILSYDKIFRNMDKIRNLYLDKGYFLADVEYRLRKEKNNQVTIIFKMYERAKVRVKKIEFIGNRKISDEELQEQMIIKTGNFLSFITSAGQFRQEMLERDAYMIGKYYADNGYINAKVKDSSVYVSPDRSYLVVTFTIEEGEKHFLGNVDFAGEVIFPQTKLRRLVGLKKGAIFNRSAFQQSMERLAESYKDLGYAYANVVPRTKVNEETRVVDVVFMMERGERVFIERINILGNTKTRDKVIRREMRIHEGDLYSGSGIRLSKRNITRLGYFETVEITEDPGKAPNQIVLNVEVKEKRTGTFQLGFGFSSVDSFVFQSQISQDNLFGRGQNLTLTAQIAETNKRFQLQFMEPYFLDSKFNLGFSVFSTQYQSTRQEDFGYYTQTVSGFSLTSGYPFTDDFTLFLSYGLDFTDLNINDPVHLHLFKDGLTSSITATLQYDTRNNRLFPTNGWLHQFSTEYADDWTGSDLEFTKFRLMHKFFYPLFWKVVFKAKVEWGYVVSLEEPKANSYGQKDYPGVPISERYLLGGIFTIRGYDYGTISPEIEAVPQSDPTNYPLKYNIGGNKQFVSNWELEFPVIEKAQISWVFFFDAGNTWSEHQQWFYLGQQHEDDNHLPLGLFMSYGFGFRWYSPIGPLRFEWGIPLTKRPEDEDIGFEFMIGNAF